MTPTVLEEPKPKTRADLPDSCPVELELRKTVEERDWQLNVGQGIPREAMMERLRESVTFENLPDEAKEGIEEGLKDIAAGRVHTHEEVEKELFG